MPRGRTHGIDIANARTAYELDLARGCSYIISTLTADARDRAVAEVLREFRELYGDGDLPLFKELLVEVLQRRGERDAAFAVVDFKFTG
jgi:hypothetical protein